MRNFWIFVTMLYFLSDVYGNKSNLRNTMFIKYTDNMKSWKEAQSFCRNKHTDLATITEDSKIFANDWLWIGLYRDDVASPWKWSRGGKNVTTFNCFFDSDGSEPDDNACCGDMLNDKWYDWNCDAKESFVCSEENLVLVKENKTWEEALDHCRSLGAKGEDSENSQSNVKKSQYDLVTLISDDDHVYARETAQEASTDEVWTGLRFIGDNWYWVGGEAVEYQNTPSCQPFECGVLEKSSNSLFGTRRCSERRNFLCYKKT